MNLMALMAQKKMMDHQKLRQVLVVLRKRPRDEPLHSEREEGLPQPEEDTIPQPMPFQMGVTPQEETQTGDELADWYETPTSDARGSLEPGPVPKAKAIGRRERSPRKMRNRQVARSIRTEQRVHWNLQAQKRERGLKRPWTVEQMKMEWDLQENRIYSIEHGSPICHNGTISKMAYKMESNKRSCGSWYDRSVDCHYPKRKSSKKGNEEIKER